MNKFDRGAERLSTGVDPLMWQQIGFLIGVVMLVTWFYPTIWLAPILIIGSILLYGGGLVALVCSPFVLYFMYLCVRVAIDKVQYKFFMSDADRRYLDREKEIVKNHI